MLGSGRLSPGDGQRYGIAASAAALQGALAAHHHGCDCTKRLSGGRVMCMSPPPPPPPPNKYPPCCPGYHANVHSNATGACGARIVVQSSMLMLH